MKRPNRYGGSHAQAPQPTRITAIIIISFFIAAVLIGLILLICASHKLSGGINEAISSPSCTSALASPLGGDTAISTPSIASEGQQATTHILHDEPLEGREDGNAAIYDRLHEAAATGNSGSACPPQQRDRPAIEVMQQAVVEAQKARVRADLVARINAFLGNSPMRGLGDCMMQNAERTGVWVMLCPAQAYAESSLGAACCYPFQAWGMYGVHPSSWEDAIARYFDNIVRHWGPARSAFELRGHCVPDEPYLSGVQRLAESI